MKKILYSFLTLAMLYATPGCADMLNTSSPDKITVDKYYSNQNEAMAGLAAAYAFIAYPTKYMGQHKFAPEEYRSDMAYLGPDSRGNNEFIAIYNYNLNNNISIFNSIWAKCYDGIVSANRLLETVPNISAGAIDEEVRQTIISEAYFIRAYFHLYLQMNFHNIVIRDKAPSGINDVDKPLASREDAWAFIFSDFETAANGAMAKSNKDRPQVERSRATKNSALAYWAHGLVNSAYEKAEGGFGEPNQETLKKAIEIIDQIDAELVSDYSSLFDGTNMYSNESMFERPFSDITEGGFNLSNEQPQWILAAQLGGFGQPYPSDKLFTFFDKEKQTNGDPDLRAIATAIWDCDYWNTRGQSHFPFEYTDVDGTLRWETFEDIFTGKKDSNGSFMKLISHDRVQLYGAAVPEDVEDNPSLITPPVQTNISLMRYANTLLYKAECLAKTGDEAGAFAIINNIRTVHGNMPATTETDIMKAIEHERVMDLTFEDTRFYDIRRWGKLATEIELKNASGDIIRKFVEGNDFYPVPAQEIENNAGIIKKD